MSRRLETVDHHHHHETCEEEEEEIFLQAIVYDAQYLGEKVPLGFNAVRVCIDGRMQSELSWERERQVAENYIKQGLRIFWEIDLGLFQHLQHPLENPMQFHALCLAMEHFRVVLWKPYQGQSVGVCVYRGTLDFSLGYNWSAEQQANLREWLVGQHGGGDRIREETGLTMLFCRDAISEYLDLLLERLPDSLKCFMLLDARGIEEDILAAQLATPECFPRLNIGVRNISGGIGNFSWEGAPTALGTLASTLPEDKGVWPVVGVCLPNMRMCVGDFWRALQSAVDELKEKGISFRYIPEHSLTSEWDGLDYLYVSFSSLNQQGKRKIQGFIAAGGEVVNVDKAH